MFTTPAIGREPLHPVSLWSRLSQSLLRAVPCILLISLGGCATLGEIVDNPSIEHERFREEDRGHMVLTVSGDRRVIRTTYDNNNKLLICAETQADAISARSASSALEAVGKGAIRDEIIQRLTLTYARTELSDVVRQLAWQLCNARLNEHIDQAFYERSLAALQAQSMLALAHLTATDNAAVIKEMQALQDKMNADAEKERAARQAREEEATKQAQERMKQEEQLTKRTEEKTKRKKLEVCRQAAGNDQAKLEKCAAS